MPQVISLASDVVASRGQVSCTLNGDAAILQVDHGVYYSLDAVGARVWQILQEPTSVTALRDLVCAEYEVDPTRCEQDLLILLHELAEASLIEVQN